MCNMISIRKDGKILPKYICWDVNRTVKSGKNMFFIVLTRNGKRISTAASTVLDAVNIVIENKLKEGIWTEEQAAHYYKSYDPSMEDGYSISEALKRTSVTDIKKEPAKRKYDLPKHVCWDVTCDLYHANFHIDGKTYSYKRHDVKGAMDTVASTYKRLGKWTDKEVLEYYTTYRPEMEVKPISTRIDKASYRIKKVVNYSDDIVANLMKVARYDGHNKDEYSLRNKAKQTARILEVLKNKNTQNVDLLKYDSKEGAFLIEFCYNETIIDLYVKRNHINMYVNKQELPKKIFTIYNFCKNYESLTKLLSSYYKECKVMITNPPVNDIRKELCKLNLNAA